MLFFVSLHQNHHLSFSRLTFFFFFHLRFYNRQQRVGYVEQETALRACTLLWVCVCVCAVCNWMCVEVYWLLLLFVCVCVCLQEPSSRIWSYGVAKLIRLATGQTERNIAFPLRSSPLFHSHPSSPISSFLLFLLLSSVTSSTITLLPSCLVSSPPITSSLFWLVLSPSSSTDHQRKQWEVNCVVSN